MPANQIFIGDQVLHGSDRSGDWIVESLEGWHEPPSPKGSTVDRVNGHGEFDVPDYYSARMVTVSGILFHKTRAHGIHAMEALGAAMSLAARQLVVTDAGATRSVDAKLAGLDWTEAARSGMRFQARFRCVDSFKYGERRYKSVASGGSDTVFHRGTVGAWPRVTISGSMPDGYTVTIGGQSVSVPMGIPSGATHTIDYRRRRLYINGSLFMGAFGSQNFRSIPPGQRTSVSLSAVSGSGSAGVTVYDTYI